MPVMTFPIRLFAASVATALLSACAAEAPPAPDPTTLDAVALTPGLYTLKTPGLGQGPGSGGIPKETCLGPQAAAVWAEKILGEDLSQTLGCSNTSSDTTGRRVMGKLVCPMPGNTATTEITYTGANDADSFVVTAQVSMVPTNPPPGVRTLSYPISFEGKRKGDCE